MTITKKNGKYYCRFQINGERHHYLCNGATSVKEAKLIEDGFRYKLQQQQNGVIAKEDKKTTQSVIDYYLMYAENKKSYETDKSRIKLIKEYFRNIKFIKEIKSEHIEGFKKFLLKREITKTTVNRYLEVLSKMFNMAIDNEWLIKNPIKKGMKFPIKNYQLRFLTEDEEVRIFNVCPAHFKPLIICALNTGLRKSNIQHLRWNNVFLEDRLIEITENKGNKHIKIYINDILYDTLSSINKNSEFVFINPRTKRVYSDECFRDYWNGVKTAAGIDNLRFHDLRHTVGTRLAKANVPVPVIKEVLAHSDVRTTMRYIHSAQKEVQEAMSVLNSYN